MAFIHIVISWLAAASVAVSDRLADTVCYGDLGCFTTALPWTSAVRPIPALPEDPSLINTEFRLFTRKDPESGTVLKAGDAMALYNSDFNEARRTIFLVHGWTNNASHQWIVETTRQIFINNDVNLFTVDWAAGAGIPYLRAATNAQVVGAELSKFILFLTAKTLLKLDNIHIVGHDLGAHIAGYAGHRVYGLGRITALDPSTIYFEGGEVGTRLDAGDALFVDVVHTDAPYKKHVGLGFSSAIGHADIYVNNGQQQPGCTDTINDLVRSAAELVTYKKLDGPIDSYVCSHMRSVDYFVESINSFCPFTAYPCASWDKFTTGECFSPCHVKECTSLGYHAGQYSAHGIFYTDTQSYAPFCNVAIRLELDVYATQAQTHGTINYILIGDVGQTKEAEFFNGLMASGFILSKTISMPGSNAYRIGHVDAVRLIYIRNNMFSEKELILQIAIVQQANITIETFNTVFTGVALSNDQYYTIYPQQ